MKRGIHIWREFYNHKNSLICAKHSYFEKTLKSSGKSFIYGKLLRLTNKVSLRFLLRDPLHETLFPGNLEGNIIHNHS